MFVFPLMEFLASTIRQDKEIKSIYIRKEELKLFQIWDDHVCRKFLKNPQKTAGTNEWIWQSHRCKVNKKNELYVCQQPNH